MKKLPWASWKFWNRVPVSPIRRVQLGIDYGTSMSNMVFRDNVPGRAESAVPVLHNGSVRIPSRVCMTATELLFGDDTKCSADCAIYDSLKMRVAVEVSGDRKYFVGPEITLPDGFTAADLAALTVWFLISEGHRAIAVKCEGRMEGVETRMSMGVPMAFFNNRQLRASFLSIANRAWTFFCNEGPNNRYSILGILILRDPRHPSRLGPRLCHNAPSFSLQFVPCQKCEINSLACCLHPDQLLHMGLRGHWENAAATRRLLRLQSE